MATAARQEDLFANIAAQRVETQKTALIEPLPPARPSNHLPVHTIPPDAPKGFQPSEKLRDAAGLRTALSELRERMKPFLQKLAPPLPATRAVQRLDSFQWRSETAADLADFASVLAGGGVWETVRIPHYGGPLGRAVTYYRTTFDITPVMLERGALFICCKGVDYKAHLFVNGAYLGSHEGFFAPFEFEFTAQARPGNNTLLVKVENDAICMGNNSWGDDGMEFEGDKIYAATGPGYDEPEVGWHHCPPGMGIYQELRIEARTRLFIHDIFVRPLPAENRAEAWVELWNCDPRRQPAKLSLSVYGQNFQATVCEDRDFPLPGPLGPRVNYYRINLELPEHRTWEPDTPWLYQLQARLLDENGDLLDAAARQFGIRSFSMDTENEPRGRMFLNGREIRLRGANTMGFEQQDVMKEDWNQLIDDILLAKLCNMNFLRLTQRPVQDEVYAYCDQLGMLTQTDLPLFGKMRRSQFAEGVRQAGEMERLIRAHPCNIMVSYTNEPFPASWGLQLWRHLSRHELESFFLACDQTVRLENPDRVIKAVDGDYDPPGPGLPDNHCYCCWYNGHGVEIGKLHRGYWQRVKPGWHYGCGEFGAEGLDFADLMRRRYPAAWLPQTATEERDWSPNRIKQAQTGRFHYMWFDTRHSVEDWVSASQTHQSWATRIMTEALRRDSRLNTCAIHLFIDAFPAGWMKTIMDVERRPKPAFFAYREALTPLMVNLRADRFAYFAGETAELEAWLCNDTHDQPAGARLAYRLEVDGKALSGGCTAASIPVCSSASVGLLRFQLPAVPARSTATVRLALLDSNGAVLHDTAVEFTVFPVRPAAPADFRISVIGGGDGKAATLARELGLSPSFTLPAKGDKQHSIIIDDLAAFRRVEQEVASLVRDGSTAVFLELPEGKHELLTSGIEVKNCGMNPLHFVSRATGHPLVAEFAHDDFKFWYDAAVGHPSPLLERTFTGDGWNAILATGNGGWGGEWGPALAAAEKPLGNGRIRICNVKLAGRTANPVALLFSNLLIYK